ncbi:MAG: hypothetical protein AAGA38_04365 [Pseudomonadota bacterium]
MALVDAVSKKLTPLERHKRNSKNPPFTNQIAKETKVSLEIFQHKYLFLNILKKETDGKRLQETRPEVYALLTSGPGFPALNPISQTIARFIWENSP